MRAFLMIGATLITGAAYADQDREVRPERTDMAVTAPDDNEDGDATTERAAGKAATKHNTTRSNRTRLKGAPAQDYSPGRSSKTSAVAAAADVNHDTSRPDTSRASSAAPGQDYNSSRSNNGSAGIALHDDDDDGDGIGDGSRAQNHNSSRSNRTQPASVCRDGVDDDCDDTDRAASPANDKRR